MNQTFNVFQTGKEKARNVLINLHGFLTSGQEMGADIDERLKDKLLNAIHDVDGEKLRVALVGPFSDGKTSIAAAWLNNPVLCQASRSHQESANPIHFYEINDQLMLIDTPGLFGVNEGMNDETGEWEKLRDITKKYLSEAHLILYVMNSVNPIKESHTRELKWLFRELQLLPRTVFVLSRFDEVTDIEDERDYQACFSIKKMSLLKRLDQAIYMSDKEKNTLSLVAVSANPYDMGLEYWSNHQAQFDSLSRIDKLKQAILDKIKANGGAAKIDLNMHNAVIRDVLKRNLPMAVANDEKIEQELVRLEAIHGRLAAQLAYVQSQIKMSQSDFIQFINCYFADLKLQAEGCTRDTLISFYHQVLGDNLAHLDKKIYSTLESHMLSIYMQMGQIVSNMKNEIANYNNIVKLLGVQQNQDLIMHDNQGELIEVSATEESLSIRHLGSNVTLALKSRFEEEATLSLERRKINDAFSQWEKGDENWQSMTVKSHIEMLSALLDSQHNALLNILDVDLADFEALLFSQKSQIECHLAELVTAIERIKSRREKFAKWRIRGEEIAADFAVFS